MPQLHNITTRLANIDPFIRRVLEDVCQQAIEVLKTHSPGKTLPTEWSSEVRVSGGQGLARIYHSRLEGNRNVWEVVFRAHNSGSVRHFIAPVNVQALSWVDGGTRYFSKGHYVEGVAARHFAERCTRVIEDYEQTLGKKWTRWIETGSLP